MSNQPQSEAQQIAGAILDQLGARRFMVMTGAFGVVATARGMQFQLPARAAREGINMVRVELDEFDAYRVIVGRWRRSTFIEKASESSVRCEDLQGAFVRLTGLAACL